MELWGGIECSLNRVGNRQFDQLARNGHYERGSDLEKIASLGVRTLRYPLLWEHATRNGPACDWRFADARLPALRALGITPIAGLVHHGCGPGHAALPGAQFVDGLAAYAGAVAERFPWLEWYTPVNEPLTTARFSGLYGLWFPHGRSGRVFARFLIDECRATVLAMRAIRRVNPRAKLLQTDDLGTIYSTARLAYQARFENERRWLGWDLLCGRVDRGHPFHGKLLGWGIEARELDWFCENVCEPDVIGIDHYVTSDRFLDEDCARYPAHHQGGNSRERYADVEAVRVLERPGTSLRHVIVAAAQRYRKPVVLSEVHIGCTPDEQIRWLHEAWVTAEQLAATGVDVRAVTCWALFGSYGWDTLLTSSSDRYEAGAFEMHEGELRATALAAHIRNLTGDRLTLRQRGIDGFGEGWWRRPERLLHGVALPGVGGDVDAHEMHFLRGPKSGPAPLAGPRPFA
jgi:dTDP-4-dehydrorhamnose reductase